MKKIVLVIPSLKAGGMERVMSELAGHFSKKKTIELHLILYGITREIFYKVPESTIIHKPKFAFNNSKRFISTIKTLYFLRNKLKEINPDTLLSFGVLWNNFVLLACIGLNIPIFISDRSQPGKSLGTFQDIMRKWLYPKAAGIILQSSKAKEIYQKKYKNINIKVIGNPIRSIEKIDNLRKENIVLMVGRLIKTKHQDRLVKIFSRINNPNWKLVLVGYDDLKQNNSTGLKKLIKNLHLKNNVILTGKQQDVESYYLKSKIFAFTSSSEGFPNVIGEAMSAGLPVVAYDCVAGPSEMIKDGKNGFLIPPFNDLLFRNKLELLMNDIVLNEKIGIQAKKDIEKFNLKIVGEKFYNFILSNN